MPNATLENSKSDATTIVYVNDQLLDQVDARDLEIAKIGMADAMAEVEGQITIRSDDQNRSHADGKATVSFQMLPKENIAPRFKSFFDHPKFNGIPEMVTTNALWPLGISLLPLLLFSVSAYLVVYLSDGINDFSVTALIFVTVLCIYFGWKALRFLQSAHRYAARRAVRERLEGAGKHGGQSSPVGITERAI